MSETLILAAILIPVLVVSIVFHEVAHGWMALMLGDTTAKERRRLTLNPIRHVDPIGTLVVPGTLALVGGPVFGWAKPVPVNKWRLNNPRFGMMAVAAAGPLTNVVLALLASVALGLAARGLTAPPSGAFELVVMGLNYAVLVNLFLALFNMMPIPPFDGSHILEGLLPPRLAAAYDKLRPLGMVLFAGLILVTWLFPDSGVIERVILPPVEWLRGHMMQLALAIAGS